MTFGFLRLPELAIALALILPTPLAAQNIQTEPVAFAPGTSGTTLQGSLTGDQIVDYVLGASGGQEMTVDMSTTNASGYFNIMKAGDPAAIYNASLDGLHYSGVLPSSGDWVIRVYLMRNAARRGETTDYTIAVNIGGSGGMDAAAAVGEACRAAVVGVANTSDVAVTGTEFSEAGTMVSLAVGPNRAAWQCIEYEDGSTAGVMFLGDDSAGVPDTPAPDFADGDAGGPDWWAVSVAGSLNVRSGPGTTHDAVGKVANGQRLRNLGCEGAGDDRWCQVEVEDGAYRGWVSGVYLRESAAPGAAATGTPAVTESAAMGPDFWEVTGVPAGDYLNLRSGVGTDNPIVARASNGQSFRNLGCEGTGDGRWCHVETPDGVYNGWVSGTYLREGAGPSATGPGLDFPSDSPLVPDLHVRETGEIEAAWSTGCTVLYGPAKSRITAGASCSDAQLIASDLWVAQMEQ